MKRRKLPYLWALLLALPLAAQAEDEKIDPANYICAEFVAQGAVSQDPPVFQALQIDGYVSSNIGYTVADPQAINVLVPQAYLMCQEQPTAVVDLPAKMFPSRTQRSRGSSVSKP